MFMLVFITLRARRSRLVRPHRCEIILSFTSLVVSASPRPVQTNRFLFFYFPACVAVGGQDNYGRKRPHALNRGWYAIGNCFIVDLTLAAGPGRDAVRAYAHA